MRRLAIWACLCMVGGVGMSGVLAAVDQRPERELQLAFSRHTLENGLRVIVREDHSSHMVVSALSVGAGSKDEEPGQTGLAHLVEHALAAHIMTSQRYAGLIAAASIGLGAQTDKERTNYPIEFPREQIEFGLFLQSLLFPPVRISSDELEKARREVLSERKQMWSHPNQAFVDRLEALVSSVKGYEHGPLGEEADLKAVTLEMVSTFIEKHYRPDNVVVALIGDINAAEALAIVRRRLGSVASRHVVEQSLERVPTRKGGTREVMRDARLRQAIVGVGYGVPPYLSDDYYALSVVAVIVNRRASQDPYKFVERLAAGVRRQCDANMFGVSAEVMTAGTGEDAEKAIQAQVDMITTAPPSEAEIAIAKNRLQFQQLEYFETPGRLASYLVDRELCTGDPSIVNSHVSRIGAVSPEDVARVVKRYLRPDNRSVVVALPDAKTDVTSSQKRGL